MLVTRACLVCARAAGCAAGLRCCAAACAHSAQGGCCSACMLHALCPPVQCCLCSAGGCLSMLCRHWRHRAAGCAHCAPRLAPARWLQHCRRACARAGQPRARLWWTWVCSSRRCSCALLRAGDWQQRRHPSCPCCHRCRRLNSCCCICGRVCRSTAAVAAAAATLLRCPSDQCGSSRAHCRVVRVRPCAAAAVGCGGACVIVCNGCVVGCVCARVCARVLRVCMFASWMQLSVRVCRGAAAAHVDVGPRACADPQLVTPAKSGRRLAVRAAVSAACGCSAAVVTACVSGAGGPLLAALTSTRASMAVGRCVGAPR